MKNIKGIKINNIVNLICQFTDDTNLFLEFDRINLEQVTDTLETVERNTGLKVNYDKTCIYCIGFACKFKCTNLYQKKFYVDQ